MPESYAGKINRKLLKKQRIIAAAAVTRVVELNGGIVVWLSLIHI